MPSRCLLLLLLTASGCLPGVVSLRHGFGISTVRTLVAPLGTPFGFLTGGHYELTVKDFAVQNVRQKDAPVKNVEAGFYLKRFDNEAQFTTYVENVRFNRTCVFEYQIDEEEDLFQDSVEAQGAIASVGDGILLSMNSGARSISYQFKTNEAGLYFLLYQICPDQPQVMLRSTFEVEYHWYNYDRWGNKSYLPAGEMILPGLFFWFACSYLLCLILWGWNIRRIRNGEPGLFGQQHSQHRPIIYAIHHLMTIMILLKFISVLAESIRYHFIRVTGAADAWTFIYYTINFVKGAALFIVILLIGSGWSIVKPLLHNREKNVILAVLVLQCINQLALTVLSREISGERGFDSWTAILHIVDILCCCVVLVPIVWQVNALERSIGEGADQDDVPHDEREDQLSPGERTQILSKLRLFRSFYLIVVAYIYATRILVYLFASILDYRHIWVRYFVVELVTLTFYVTVGLMFRPFPEGMYASIGTEEERAPTPRKPAEPALEMELVDSPM